MENIVSKLSCSPHEFIEIYQEGKALVCFHSRLRSFSYVVQSEHVGYIAKPHEEWDDGTERVIKFVSDAYAPEKLLKIMGCNLRQLKEQQELRINDGLFLIHSRSLFMDCTFFHASC